MHVSYKPQTNAFQFESVQRFVQIQTCLQIKLLCSALICHKLLMQKGIRAFLDQVACVHLLTSCSVHLDFETSFSQFTAFHNPPHITTNKQGPVQFIIVYTIWQMRKFASLHWNKCLSTNVCRVKNYINVQYFVPIETFVNKNVIVCIKVSQFVHVEI